MKTAMDLYTDYLLNSLGLTTTTGLTLVIEIKEKQ